MDQAFCNKTSIYNDFRFSFQCISAANETKGNSTEAEKEEGDKSRGGLISLVVLELLIIGFLFVACLMQKSSASKKYEIEMQGIPGLKGVGKSGTPKGRQSPPEGMREDVKIAWEESER